MNPIVVCPGSVMRCPFVLALALTPLGSAVLLGDQLAWNSLDVSKRAIAAISARPLLATYCSLCNSERIEIFEARQAVIMPTETKDLYEVAVFGKRLFESVETLSPGDYREPIAFRPVVSERDDRGDIWELRPLDLAYTYILSEDGSLHCLGTVMNLRPDVKVERINLPPDVAGALRVGTIAQQPPAGPASASTGTLAADFSPGSPFRDCDLCPEMVVIPAGSFSMGSPSKEQGRADDEGPQHTVNILRALAVGKHEVTRGQYAQFVRETGHASSGCRVVKDGRMQEDPSTTWQAPGYAQNDTHPVVCVGWNDAKAFVAWLSRKSGKNYRLLTEAEWEYAARAGTTTAYYWGDNANNACQYANGARAIVNCANNHIHTAPVGSFKPNAFGLHDMSGNVWEWTEDCWNENYNGAPTQGGAWTTGTCGLRVLRGGSWDDDPQSLRSATRLLNSGSSIAMRAISSESRYTARAPQRQTGSSAEAPMLAPQSSHPIARWPSSSRAAVVARREARSTRFRRKS